jgi:hypothetical protein
MPFDFKKEYKEFYMSSGKPSIVDVPSANYLAVRGKGNPNEEGGDYKKAIEMLYSVAYTLKMSPKNGRNINGFFDYVVPPLEGFWWQEGVEGVDLSRKDELCWISVIRLPDFVTMADFEWAVETATRKKKIDCSKVEFLTSDEGLCVQILHVGAYDEEAHSVELMEQWALQNGYQMDITDSRLHHEIYLSDARKTPTEKLRTVVRHPICKK